MHRHQTQRRDAQALQVRYRGRMRQAREGPAQRLRYRRVALGKALDVQLVEYGVGQRGGRRPVIAPVECVADGARLERPLRVVAIVAQQGLQPVRAELLVAPLELPDQFARIGVKQQLGGVKAQAALGLPGPVRAQPVDQPRTRPGQVAVPDIAAARRERPAR